MGKFVDVGKQRQADIMIGSEATNIAITKGRFGTGSTAESESDTAVQTPTGSDRTVDVVSRVGNSAIMSWFFVKGTFGAITLNEFGAKYGDGVLAVRTTTDGVPIANANLYDIRVDVTLALTQS